jgi:hypothetical protein
VITELCDENKDLVIKVIKVKEREMQKTEVNGFESTFFGVDHNGFTSPSFVVKEGYVLKSNGSVYYNRLVVSIINCVEGTFNIINREEGELLADCLEDVASKIRDSLDNCEDMFKGSE